MPQQNLGLNPFAYIQRPGYEPYIPGAEQSYENLSTLGRVEVLGQKRDRQAALEAEAQRKAQAEQILTETVAKFPDRPEEGVLELRRRGLVKEANEWEKHVSEMKKVKLDEARLGLDKKRIQGELDEKKYQQKKDMLAATSPRELAKTYASLTDPEDIQDMDDFVLWQWGPDAARALKALPKDPKVLAAMAMGPEAAGSQDLRRQELEQKASGVGGSSSDFGSFLANYLQGEAAKLGKTPEELGPAWRAGQTIKARKEFGQADDAARRPLAPIVIMTPQGPMITQGADRQSVAPIMGPDGKPIGLAPTAEQRNRAAGMSTGKAVIDSIDELSKQINTQSGVIAKISGAAERAKATANLNDDVSEYNALVQGFTPLLARAVGHVGVLTEQDVQSVRSMLPQVGDSQSVRDRKMARIRKIMAQMPGGADAGMASGSSSGIQEGAQQPIPGIPGGVAEFRGGKWIRIK